MQGDRHGKRVKPVGASLEKTSCGRAEGTKRRGTFFSHGRPPQVYQPLQPIVAATAESSRRGSIGKRPSMLCFWPRQPPSNNHSWPGTKDHGGVDSGASCNSHLQTKNFAITVPQPPAPIPSPVLSTNQRSLAYMVTTSFPQHQPQHFSISYCNVATHMIPQSRQHHLA
jgi:hypothetical protein